LYACFFVLSSPKQKIFFRAGAAAQSREKKVDKSEGIRYTIISTMNRLGQWQGLGEPRFFVLPGNEGRESQ
jgi:hypothetical protein